MLLNLVVVYLVPWLVSVGFPLLLKNIRKLSETSEPVLTSEETVSSLMIPGLSDLTSVKYIKQRPKMHVDAGLAANAPRDTPV